MGSAGSSDYVDWAVSELVAGLDTPNQHILAGLPMPPYWPDVEHYLERTLADLRWSLPEPEAYLQQSLREVARAIVSGDISFFEGRDEIWRVSRALGYPDSLADWPLLDEGIDPATSRELPIEALEAAIRN